MLNTLPGSDKDIMGVGSDKNISWENAGDA